MRRQNRILLLCVTALLLAVLLYGCGFPIDSGDDIQSLQTKILKVLVQPDTVAPGDTASFTCVIKDSIDTRFKFYWLIQYGKVEGAIQYGYYDYKSGNSRSIKWIAPEKSDTYNFEVTVDNGSADSSWVKKSFSITIK